MPYIPPRPAHWLREATDVTCPVCDRRPGEVCCKPDGTALWGRPHRARLKRARLNR